MDCAVFERLIKFKIDVVMHKLSILLNAIYGEFLKICYRIGWVDVPYGITRTPRAEGERVVVSLTSYGRRVKSVLPYTIISLLRQSFKPDVIVLWLDKDHWNDANLPDCLIKLKKKGLTISYCDDIKSYKKLIPALKKYPNDIIITVDDDFIYATHLVSQLMNAWYRKPNRIYVHRAFGVTFTESGNIDLYNNWEKEISNRSDRFVFPLGGSGCLYKRELLFSDVICDELFMKLTPQADDVWFFFMELLQGTERVVLPRLTRTYILIDFFYQYTHRTAALYNINDKEGGNDPQIHAVMDYYHIKLK